MRMVQILDSTLREGEQTPGVYFDPHIKLAIAHLLDDVGVDFIEAGHPRVGPEIHSVVRTLGGAGLKATVAAHARSLRDDVDMALDCGIGMLGIFYCVSDSRLAGVFQKRLDEAVEQIASVIAYAKQQQPSLLVRYTPEDTVRSELGNVVAATVAAVEAGADIISIADTTGLMVPGTPNNLHDYVVKLKSELDRRHLAPWIAVHCHNDRGLALANALDAVRAGADIIDVSVLGLGERAGIVDMAQLMATLDQDFHVEHNWRLDKLPELYALVSQYAGVPIPRNYPIVGANAFTHCAGVHTQAANQNPLHYRSLDPTVFGRVEQVCLDHMSGGASIDYGLRQLGIEDVDAETRRRLLAEVKSIGQKGRTVSTEELAHLVAFCSARDAQPTEVS